VRESARIPSLSKRTFKSLLTGLDLNTNFNYRLTMFVCLCHVTTDSEVRRVIDRGATTVDDVGEMTGAGTGCGACRGQIHDMLEAAGRGCERAGSACADCPRPRISVALALTRDSREAA